MQFNVHVMQFSVNLMQSNVDVLQFNVDSMECNLHLKQFDLKLTQFNVDSMWQQGMHEFGQVSGFGSRACMKLRKSQAPQQKYHEF